MIGFNEKEKEKLVEILKQNWQKSGDLISKMYAGTGALDGSKDDKVCCLVYDKYLPSY